jgi:carboxypeptidase Taq
MILQGVMPATAVALAMASNTRFGLSAGYRPFRDLARWSSRRWSPSMRLSTSTAVDVEAKTTTAYAELLEALQQVTRLKQAQAVLNYDQLVFMPEAASAERGAQQAALASVIHEKATASSLKQKITAAALELEAETGVDTSDANKLVKIAQEDFTKSERIPAALEAKRAMLSSTAYAAWAKARATNDFASFCPVLTDCFETAIETAKALGGSSDKRTRPTSTSLYTVLLDEFERGMPVERIDAIFNEIETALVPLLQAVLTSPHQPNVDCLSGNTNGRTFPIDQQQELSRRIVTALGFDSAKGRIDVSVHPFTTSFGPTDVRITSRFQESEWYQGLAGSIHEAGHAMYEQNLGLSGTALDSFLSMGCHESQSLFWERHVSLSKPFWKWAAPLLEDAFGSSSMTSDWDAAQLYRAVNAVSAGLIRVTADELTYPLHVILRYRLERDVVEGKLGVAEIPNRWNAGMKELLNVTVPSDTEGCLQDVHWSGLAIAYFPTYLIGSATAAQLAHYCKADLPEFDSMIESGNFVEIKQWLTDKVHRHGRRYSSLDALLEDQLGERLNPKYFIEYLTTKYTELYGL